MYNTGGSNLHGVGKRLLQTDIHDETLDELFCSLQTYDVSLKTSGDSNFVPSYFGIPPLDRLISQNKPRSFLPVVELTSSTAGAGKTHLVYLAVAVAVLPNVCCTPTQSDAGDSACKRGKSGTAIVIDTNDCFKVERLAHTMKSLRISMIKGACSADRQTTVDDDLRNADAWAQQPCSFCTGDAKISVGAIVENALRHVLVLRPQSIRSLVATVNSLPSYLFNAAQYLSDGRAIELLALDSLSSFYWQEKLEEDISDTAHSQGTRKYGELVRSLHQVQDIFGCPILTTSLGLQLVPGPQSRRSTLRGPRPSFKPVLPHSWLSFCTLRLGVAREPVKQFHVDMTLEQAETDKSARHEVVEKGRFSAWVDALGSGAHRNGGEFEFRIRDEGVVLEESQEDLNA